MSCNKVVSCGIALSSLLFDRAVSKVCYAPRSDSRTAKAKGRAGIVVLASGFDRRATRKLFDSYPGKRNREEGQKATNQQGSNDGPPKIKERKKTDGL